MNLITSVAPECYPLSEAMLQKLAKERQIPTSFTIENFALEDRIEDRITDLRLDYLQRWWNPLIREIADIRVQAEEPLLGHLKGSEKLSTKDFVDILYRKAPNKEVGRVSSMTISRWRGRGFISESDDIAAERALAILMMRIADPHRQKGFLPSGSRSNDPYMYVWRLDKLEGPSLPQGIPLNNVPNNAFLYTPFRFLGMLYPDQWFSFGDIGSVRFAGTMVEGNKTLWNLTWDEIRQWNPSIQSLALSKGLNTSMLARDNLANLVLLNLASLHLTSDSR